jgi:uncharacterized ion transporter superfamily protein YfcC
LVLKIPLYFQNYNGIIAYLLEKVNGKWYNKRMNSMVFLFVMGGEFFILSADGAFRKIFPKTLSKGK